ncbi:hypothetical protein FH972_025898 [Carpinus fangiana]|uniref:alpha-mannosidase n=1 Tax=Carpinus fangiana TaxID=176857 RepID=A0A5N6L2R9_9ROSI|nr:hypothetical protein FH972_025898 [Carpinus fangiana]
MGGETGSRPSTHHYPKLTAKPVGKQIHSIYRDRLRQFTGEGQYKAQGLEPKIVEARASGPPAVKLSVWSAPDLTRPTFEDATKHTFKPSKIGDAFGPSWSTHWFKLQVTVPKDIKDRNHLELHWDAGNEGLVWTEDGVPLQGLTGGGERIEWILPEAYRDGKEHILYIEMACNRMFGNANGDTNFPPDPNNYYTLTTADVVAINLDARALFYDFWIIGDAAREFSEQSWEEHEALQVANAIMDAFIAGDGSNESIKEGRKIAQQYLGDKIDSEKVYEEDSADTLVSAVGHCHIDTCWLWPFAETKRKVARSWSNQCDLMDRYPEHRFVCSQAQQFKWLKMYYPALFDRVKSKVKTGQFQPIGGSWVEHDTNMPSGESLVRQFLYGQRLFESNFGERCQTFWLPDTFGYSPQIPQLTQLAGMTRFFTQKLSWNNINNFPHTTFNWVALDGSQVLCHMTPAETYTAEANFGDVKRCVTQHKSMNNDPRSLLVFGKGDGGGGPTWGHLERLRRCRGLSNTKGKLPKVAMGGSVDEFFSKLQKKADEGTDFVTWYGELYLELHRGTYTTQANNKRNNRKAEVLLHDIEFLATMASFKDDIRRHGGFGVNAQLLKSYKYPKKELDEMWELVLLCQFHDCLPGSAINMAYRESDEFYATVFKTGKKLLKDAMTALGLLDCTSESQDQVLVNTLSFDRSEIIDSTSPEKPAGSINVRGLGISLTEASKRSWVETAPTIHENGDGEYVMENHRFRIKVSEGAITSIYDVAADREVLPDGSRANQLTLYDDKPLNWQAWDVEMFHLRSRKELRAHKSAILESGPNRVSVASETKISERSSIRTVISLGAAPTPGSQEGEDGSGPGSFITVTSDVDWHEEKKFLKVEFPVDIRNTNATYETQFGLIQRPTHYNTDWDMAKFEVCCHKFADLSEAGYGVSILNDCKYGFATQGNVMRLSLLRSPKAPDGEADMGNHTAKWAILPHIGALGAETVRAAAAFNNPLVSRHHDGGSEGSSYLKSALDFDATSRILGALSLDKSRSDPAVVIDTVKRGEDDEDVSTEGAGGIPIRKGRSIIVRLYDSLGGKCRARLHFGELPVKKVVKCNVLEDDGEEVGIKDGGVVVQLRAFEVLTLRLSV